MPVKNIKRKTNDGFEGVITGLNDKEKEIIANSVASDSPKIYDIFEFVDQDYEPLSNCYEKMSALFTQGKIIGINSEEGFYLFVGEFYDGGANGFLFLKTSATESNKIGVNTLIFKADNTLSFFYTEYLPVLPADASTKNYTLEANNGTIAWTESSSGALNVVANPIDVATNTLTKLKVDDTTYAVSKISLRSHRIVKENLSHSSGSSVISYAASVQPSVSTFLTDIDAITEKGQYILSCRIVVSLTNAPLPIVLSGEWSNENPVGSRGIYANTYSKSGGIVSYFGLDDGIQASNAEYFDVLFNNISYIEYQVTYAIPVIEG